MSAAIILPSGSAKAAPEAVTEAVDRVPVSGNAEPNFQGGGVDCRRTGAEIDYVMARSPVTVVDRRSKGETRASTSGPCQSNA